MGECDRQTACDDLLDQSVGAHECDMQTAGNGMLDQAVDSGCL